MSFSLRDFNDKNVQIDNQQANMNNVAKVRYEQVTNADSYGANNDFLMLVKELKCLMNTGTAIYYGDLGSYKSEKNR